VGAEVAQSVWCLTTDWTTGVPSPSEAIGLSSSLWVQTDWCPPSLLYNESFPGGKARPGRDADHSSI